MGMSIWENNGNGNKCLAGVGMGMGMKLMGMERNGKLRAVPAQLSCVAEKETNKVRNVVANSVTFGSEFASRCSDVYTIWLLNTCLPTANPSPASLAVATCDRGHLDFPRVKLASYGGRSFAYAGPSNWNSLPAYLRDSSLSLSSFKHHLKTFLFSFY